MLYPQNGSIAMGSRRTTPAWPVAAAVVSEPIDDARNHPFCQFIDCSTNGIAVLRRLPKMNAEIGTPWGFSQPGEMVGHCRAGAVNRELGCAALSLPSHGWPFQSISFSGGVFDLPSHHGIPSGVTATLVKMVLLRIVAKAAGFVSSPVPGTTPKKPASGFTAHSRPSEPMRIQAMSSPIVRTL